MNRTDSLANTVHDPVVKSCSRDPTASTTSASAASALAEVHPVEPMGPALSRCADSSVALPPPSTTGMLCRSAKARSSSSARE